MPGSCCPPRTTVCDWLVLLRDRGLDGISDGTAPNREAIPGEVACLVIGVRLPHAPQAYGPESGPWEASMLREMILDRLGMDIKPGTLRATPHGMNYPFWTLRKTPYRSADPQTRKKFIENTQRRMDAPAGTGYVNFYQDEMTMRLSALTSLGWLRTRRPRDDKDHILQEDGGGVFAPRVGGCGT